MTRPDAAARTLTTLRFFSRSEQSPAADASGWRGFYYHFLDLQTGRRAGNCEPSSIDSAFLLASMLSAAQYFDREAPAEVEIRATARFLYERADWQWMLDGGPTLSMGWTPRSGFLRWRWQGYSEALILYLLALGSPRHPIEPASYAAWTSSYRWKKFYGHLFLYGGALFIHQFSHLWVDFRGIQDACMRAQRIDYFENSRRATYIQRAYAIRNPRAFKGYGATTWGITASDGPGPARRSVDGVARRFFGYKARGVPYGPDDGTLAPWAAVASLPFAPEIVLPTVRDFGHAPADASSKCGFRATINPTYPAPAGKPQWVSPAHLGLNQGPIVLMVENYRSGLVWRLMRHCAPLRTGLERAGFNGGWL